MKSSKGTIGYVFRVAIVVAVLVLVSLVITLTLDYLVPSGRFSDDGMTATSSDTMPSDVISTGSVDTTPTEPPDPASTDATSAGATTTNTPDATVPDATPTNSPDATPQDATPTNTPDATPTNSPDVTPTNTPTPDATPTPTPDTTPPDATPTPAPTPTDPTPTAPTHSETHAHSDDIQLAINKIAKKYGAAGVQVAVIKNGEIVSTYVYGDATKNSRAMSDDIKIRTASISKVILAMTVMRLSELGCLDIDADIGEYWGGQVRNPSHSDIPITMRQILSHTSSIIVYDYGFDAGGELIKRRFLDGSCFSGRTPGSIGSWNYNNYAFAALGLTVEVAMGETVNSLASRYLFAPLGIDAAFGGGSISATDKLATLYTESGGVGRSVDAQKRTLGSTYPGERGEEFPGGLTISAYDLAKLLAALACDGTYDGTRILSPDSVATMESSQGNPGGFDQCLPLRHQTNIYGEKELYYHTGSNYGVYNLMSYNPATRDGVVVLTSGASGVADAYGIYAICGEISECVYRG